MDNPVGDDQCQTHGEHIIHNGIRGKLISSQILCKDCGADYSKDDSAFCKIFAPFMVALKDQLIPADHGKDTYKTLPGSLFDSPTSNLDDPSRLVNVRNGVVTPVEPYPRLMVKRLPCMPRSTALISMSTCWPRNSKPKARTLLTIQWRR